MKRTYFILVLLCITLELSSQVTELNIDNQTPGWLSSKINYGDQKTLLELKVTGYINDTDLKFIGTLVENHKLKKIDLEDSLFSDVYRKRFVNSTH